MGNCECRMRVPCSRKTWYFKSILGDEDAAKRGVLWEQTAFGRLVPPVLLPQADLPVGPAPPGPPPPPAQPPRDHAAAHVPLPLPLRLQRREYADAHARHDDVCRTCAGLGHWSANCPERHLRFAAEPADFPAIRERRKTVVPKSVVITASGACFHHKGCEHVLGRHVTKLRRCETCKNAMKLDAPDA